MLPRVLLQEMIGEQEQVRFAIAQRWDKDGENIQPVVEILAEVSFRHRFLEILVRSCNQPHIGANRGRAAQAFEFLFLQHAQQFHLRGKIHVADLIQKQRAAFRQLKAAFFERVRAGEGSFLVSEQL